MIGIQRRITVFFLSFSLLISSCGRVPFSIPTIAPSPALPLTPTRGLTPTSTQIPTLTLEPLPTLSPTPITIGTPVPLPPTTEPFGVVGQVGGPTQAVAVAGDYAYVGVGLRLVILDKSEPGALREVGSSEPFVSLVEDVALSQEMAYVAAGGAGLYIVDVSNPVLPIIVGNYDTAGYAEGVTVVGAYAYVADGPDGLRVFDITNPAQPAEVSAAYKLNYAFDVAVDAGYAYVAAAGAGLLVADVSDPLQPKEAGSLDTPGNAFGINLSGSVAYVADGWEGLRILDISTPSQPQEIGFYDTQGWALDVSTSGSIAYVAFAFNAIQILDVSASNQPKKVGSYDMLGHHLGNLAIREGMVYVTSRDTGLSILNVSSPEEPARIGFYNPMGFADAVAVSGSYAYVAAGPYGLRVVDIVDLAHPREVGAFETGCYEAGVVVAGDFAFVIATGLLTSGSVDTQCGLHILNVSDPANPTKVSSFSIQMGMPRDLVIQNDILYIADERGLLLIDVSNPSSPVLLSLLIFGQGDVTTGVAVSENSAFVTHSIGGLMVADISDPRNPSLAAIYKSSTVNKVVAVTVGGKYAYVTDHPRVHIVDISNPAQPTEAGFYDLPVAAEQVTFANDRLYVADSGAGLVVLDVSDPTNSSLAGWRRLPGYAFGLTAADGYLYIADGDGGLFIIEDTAMPRQAFLSSGVQLQVATREIESILHLPTHAGVSFNSATIQPVSITARWQAGGSAASLQTGLFVAAVFQPGASTLAVTSRADTGTGTLRWALENAASGNTILFDPEVFPPDNPATIYPSTNLPDLRSGNVTIDASNAGVILDGSKSPPGSNGLYIPSDNNVIMGLQIVNFHGGGVVIGGKDNIIGGDRMRGSGPLGEGNLISGNGYAGVNIKEPRAVGNRIIGNYIGTDLTGTQAMGNQRSGVEIAAYASQNTIGGLRDQDRNVISGNEGADVHVLGQGNGNTIVGNHIGADVSGTTRLGDAVDGVLIELGGFSNIIQANVIGNGVTTSDWGSWGNEIIGNYIGIDSNGNVSLGSPENGIGIGSSYNRIGGTSPNERNIISGNGRWGIKIGLWGTTDVFVIGNYVGTDITGTRAIANQGAGIVLLEGGTRHTFIGGTSESERNLISGNDGSGIALEGIGNDYNFIIGNYIGTDASGNNPLPNRKGGVSIQGGDNNIIQRNLIAYNENIGIDIASGNKNRVHHNSFIRNGGNFDSGNDNAWDDGSEGNYWSDYSGADANGNGIGDAPYPVPPNGVDRFPLMQYIPNSVSQQPTPALAFSTYATRQTTPTHIHGLYKLNWLTPY